MHRKILLATDFSDASEQALRQAGKIGARDRAAVGLCHVLPSPMPASAGIPAWLQGHVPDDAEAERRARQGLARCVSALQAAGVRHLETFVDRGEVDRCIVQRAEAFGADLIVTGSYGRTGLARMLLGSAAEKVVRHGRSPVLVARPGPDAGPVVASTDFSEAANRGLRAAAREAARSGSALVVVHVLDVDYPGGIPYGVNAAGMLEAISGTEELRATEERLRAAASAIAGPLGVHTQHEVGIGDPAAWIVRRAEELAARLVVLSTHGRTGLSRVLLGSVAEKVVRHAHVSVLAARDAASEA